ncbi:hypothetical protein B0H14DRAFT_3452884 [Mycena olivaceomarginata]|nr:hypothetical protein B0H14DRAFT_3452884 [Mycena olivaceomarginata]
MRDSVQALRLAHPSMLPSTLCCLLLCFLFLILFLLAALTDDMPRFLNSITPNGVPYKRRRRVYVRRAEFPQLFPTALSYFLDALQLRYAVCGQKSKIMKSWTTALARGCKCLLFHVLELLSVFRNPVLRGTARTCAGVQLRTYVSQWGACMCGTLPRLSDKLGVTLPLFLTRLRTSRTRAASTGPEDSRKQAPRVQLAEEVEDLAPAVSRLCINTAPVARRIGEAERTWRRDVPVPPRSRRTAKDSVRRHHRPLQFSRVEVRRVPSSPHHGVWQVDDARSRSRGSQTRARFPPPRSVTAFDASPIHVWPNDSRGTR